MKEAANADFEMGYPDSKRDALSISTICPRLPQATNDSPGFTYLLTDGFPTTTTRLCT